MRAEGGDNYDMDNSFLNSHKSNSHKRPINTKYTYLKAFRYKDWSSGLLNLKELCNRVKLKEDRTDYSFAVDLMRKKCIPYTIAKLTEQWN